MQIMLQKATRGLLEVILTLSCEVTYSSQKTQADEFTSVVAQEPRKERLKTKSRRLEVNYRFPPKNHTHKNFKSRK